MDFKGDRERKDNSVVNQIGIKNTLLIANILLVISIIVSWLPIIFSILGQIYLVYIIFYSLVISFIYNESILFL
jgi:4-hydroxybenzoate polyprenyltransferase